MKPNACDPKSFADGFGFDIPESFQTFISILYDAAKGDRNAFSRIADDLFFFRPSTELNHALGWDHDSECRYNQTPLELIPFGDNFVDGTHIGFVVATPELPADEFPIGVFNPLDFDIVALSGVTFKAALERRVGELLQERGGKLDDAAHELVQTLQQELKLSVKPVANDMGWSTQQPLGLTPPPGYSQLPTSDGISVLAPKSFIWEKRQVSGVEIDEALNAAQQFSNDGLLGNALHTLRQAAWKYSAEDAARRAIARSMVDVYGRLNRPVLARLASRRAQGEF